MQKFIAKFFTSETLKDDDCLLADIKAACSLALTQCDRISTKNLDPKNWQEKKESLLYLLLEEGRFREEYGEFGVVYYDDQIVALAGVYLDELDPKIAICGSRGWVRKDFRGNFLLAKYLLPRQEQWAKDRGCRKVWITFNECNRAMALRKKLKDGPRKNILLGKKDPEYFYGFSLLSEKKIIKLTHQYVWEKPLAQGPGETPSLL